MSKTTVLNEAHRRCGGKLVDFAGWELPLHYGSQLAEHVAVRTAAGMFDVSHMGVIDLFGAGAPAFVRHLLANDVSRLAGPGAALYACMLNPDGGIRDDVIVYWLAADAMRIVVNAATRDGDFAWIAQHAVAYGVEVVAGSEFAMIAVQGPQARERARAALGLPATIDALGVMHFARMGDVHVARTGYTGEDGYELIVPNGQAGAIWEALRAAGVVPCGLGARDSLRLEAGLRLYGSDMDASVTPYDCGLGWTVALEPADRDFIGRAGLMTRKDAGAARFVGLLLEEPGVLRSHLHVRLPGGGEGLTTSGGYAPTLDRSIGFARVPPGSDSVCSVEIRGHWKRCRIVPPRFVRRGQALLAV